MIIASFDVGIRNLAFCILEIVDNSNINVIKWIVEDFIPSHKKVDNVDYAVLCSHCVNCLDRHYPYFSICDEIIIEKQPTKNQKMKNVSFCIFTYFVMKFYNNGKLKKIRFVNPINKLNTYPLTPIKSTYSDKYKSRKFIGKKHCEYYIANNIYLKTWFLTHKKKDDLADSFLQNIWYINYYKVKLCLTCLKIKQKIFLKPNVSYSMITAF